MMMANYSIYLHIPFCHHRCSYCDFNTYAGQEQRIPAYVEALCREINLAAQSSPNPLAIHTIFFGGGTPSLLPPEQLDKILTALRQGFTFQQDMEITLEANPGTLAPGYLETLHELGFNRLSLGMQSANPEDLALLERQHQYFEVIQSVKWARQAGFNNVNLDLIFGIPHQTMERWQATLGLALGLNPEHLSLYALTLEHGTPFQRWTERGLIPLADDDLAADMYEWASERLDTAGYCQYEISNWARRKTDGDIYACLHNLQYWRNQPYLGFGAGAHGSAAGYRTADVLGIQAYIAHCAGGSGKPFPTTPATITSTPIDRRTEMQETMMVGLRLTEEGVSARRFKQRFGESLAEVFGNEIAYLVGLGLLEWAGEDNETLRLTRRGRLLGNQVFMQFVGD
ncbi:MAG: radical SAM family heme chaperone HemW [Chloroflexi bacterium]|nr:radical SAM family heme chaperone HemW [Chloroflexota bacterium]